MMKGKRRGFTVVELVIVIAVVAILAAVLIPTYINLVKKSNEANALAEAKNLISEMLTDIILGDKDSADLLIFSKKGDDVYLHGYSAEQQKFLTYRNNPIPLTTNMETTVQATVGKLLAEEVIKQNPDVDIEKNPNDWRLEKNVRTIVGSLNSEYDVVVYANYIIDANLFAQHVHTWGTTWAFDETHHWHKCVGCDEITGKAEHVFGADGKCKDCGAIEQTVEHKCVYDKENVADKYRLSAANCTHPAVYYYSCACGEVGTETFEDGTALGHSFGDGKVESPSTCTTQGRMKYTCTRCGEPKEVAIPALGHNPEKIEGKAATCTEKGLTDGEKCSRCQTILVEQKEIAAKGHTLVKDAAVAATCVTKGKTEGSHCSVCNAVIKAQESTDIDPNNHESIKWKHKICLKAPSFDEEKQIFIANESYSPMNYFFGIFDREFTYVQLDWECDVCKRKNDSVLEGGIIFTDYKDSKGNPVEPGNLKCGETYEVTIKCNSQIISESFENGDEQIPHCNSEWKVKIYIDHWHVNNAFDDSIGEECFYCHKTIESAPNTHIIGIETEGYLEDLTAGK